MSPNQTEIIQQLRTYPPNTIYFLAEKHAFLNGIKYARTGALESYAWDESQSKLVAFIRGGHLYEVSFSLMNEQLRCVCTCPAWTAASHCKHVICAFLMTIHLLSPKSFRILTPPPGRAEQLRSRLLPPETIDNHSTDRYEIIIYQAGNRPTLGIRKQGRGQVAWPPHELYQLVTFYEDICRPSTPQPLLDYLNKYQNTYPLILKTHTGETPLRWTSEDAYEAKTEMDCIGDQVRVRERYFLRGHPRDIYRFWGFAADIREGTLHWMKDTSGWALAGYLYDRLMLSTPGVGSFTKMPFPGQTAFSIPLDVFQGVQIDIPTAVREAKLRDLILKVAGRVSPIGQAQYTYRLMIEPAREKHVTLRAECLLENVAGTPTASTFQLLFRMGMRQFLPASFRTKKGQQTIYTALFRLMEDPTRVLLSTRIVALLSEGNSENAGAVKKLLKDFLMAFTEADERLQLVDGRWVIAPNNKAKEAMLYKIPFEVFGASLFKAMSSYYEMSLPTAVLFRSLPLLRERLAAAGIMLFYRNKPVTAVGWEFSFDATRSAGMNWFEIKPEIQSDGRVVDKSLWEEALQKDGILEREDVIEVLDANSQKILKLLSTMSDNAKRKEKDVVHIPRLQILDWIELRKEGVRIRLSKEDEAMVDQLLHFEKIRCVPLPKKLRATLRSYQESTYQWLSFLYQHRLGACLADDMGLGKTLQAISLLAGLLEGKVPAVKAAPPVHLIVVPPSLLFNWGKELDHFYPSLRVHPYVGKERDSHFTDCDVVLTTYALVRRDIETLQKIPFHVIIFDEAQVVKNIYAETTRAVRRLAGAFKIVMTGTPLENHLGEYYALVDLALPGLLGDYETFKASIRLEGSSLLPMITVRSKPFVMRRTKSDVLKDLPSRTETDIYLDLTEKQKTLYQQTVARVNALIDAAYQNKAAAQAQVIALTALLRLRQICLCPRLVVPNIGESSPKIDFLLGQVYELLAAKHSALVFSQFTSFLDILEKEMRLKKIPFSRLDGSTPIQKRKALVEGFQEGSKPSVFLLSLKVGGQGLNLTRASYVFHLDPWWNPAVEDQASDRTHRIGQTQKVSIVRILMRHTIEEKMMALKEKKRALYQAVMGGTLNIKKHVTISKADFDFLLAQ